MAQPSSSREHREPRDRDRDRDRDREHRSSRSTSTRHHRTISSTTLLLVLSLVLAVLAVMLSLPSNQLPPIAGAGGPAGGDPDKAQGVWGILTPKRSQALVARESNVAVREAEVARREAELLAGAPGGVLPTATPLPVAACPSCPTLPVYVPEPVQTIIKEVVREADALSPPGWFKEGQVRFEDILDRELKIADRERDIGRREESVNRREHDASRREAWIMEQLIALGNDEPGTVEEEYIYESSPRQPPLRKPKFLPIEADLPPLIYTETELAVEYKTVTHTQHHTHTHTLPSETVTLPAPAKPRVAAFPTPEAHTVQWSTGAPKTTSVQYITEEIIEEPIHEIIEEEEEAHTVTVVRNARPGRPPKRWLGGW